MSEDLLRLLLSRLSSHSFGVFVLEFFAPEATSFEPFSHLGEAGQGIFYEPVLDSYGGSLHNVFLCQYLPSRAFRVPDAIDPARDPTLIRRLKDVRSIYENQTGFWGMVSECRREDQKLQSVGFLVNLSGIPESEYHDALIPRYARLLENLEIPARQCLLGSYDSFVIKNAQKAEQALRKFLYTHEEGISICLHEDRVRVAPFAAENCLSGAVSRSLRHPLEPVFRRLEEKRQILAAFETLIQGSSREVDLEEFLIAHYKDIFGSRYDRIETQLWLRFPDLDIADKDRRCDLFLRDSVAGDWELHEVKRPIKLTSTYRDVPVITHEVQHATQQLRNYSRILTQDTVKRQLASQGIEYFEPSLNLIIGRRPQIPQKQWRWLMATHGRDVRIVTFDDLLRESRQRLRDRESLLNLSDTVFKTGQHSDETG